MAEAGPAPVLQVEFKALSALPPVVGAADEVLVVMPFIDPDQAKRSAQQLARRAGIPGRLYGVYDDKRIGFVAAINAVFARTPAPYVAYVAQDAFAGRDWLKRGVAALAKDDGGLLAFNDGKWNGILAAFGLAERGWAHANYGGDFFMPEYKRHYADAELTLIALQQKKMRYDPASMLIEVDWEKEDQAVESADRLLFHLRARSNYDGMVFDAQLRRVFS